MRSHAARGDTARAAELFSDSYKSFELEEQHARARSASHGQRLLRTGINQAIAGGKSDLAATRIVAAALLAGGNTPGGQFRALAEAKQEWQSKVLNEPTPLNRFVVWRIAKAMDERGFDAELAFAGASAAGRALIDLQFGDDKWKWQTDAVFKLLRRARADGTRSVVATIREPSREIQSVLTALSAYADRLDAGEDLESRIDRTTEAWELQPRRLLGQTTAFALSRLNQVRCAEYSTTRRFECCRAAQV